MRLEKRGGELRHLGLHLRAGHVQRGPAHRLRPAAEGADALLHDARIAVQDRDVFERHAELVGEHLREGRFVPLTVRRRAGGGADPAVPFDRHLRVFPPAGRQRRGRADAAHLHVHRESQADQPSLGAGGVALGLQALPLGRFERHVERLLVVARVVDGAHLRRERKLMRLDEVLPAELRRIHLQLAREHVHRALDEVGRFGTAGAAIGIGRRLVGEDLGQRRADRRNVVGRVRHHHRERRDGRRQQHVVGADVGDQAKLQAEHRAVALRREIHVAEDVAAVGRGHEGLRAVFRPLHGNAEALRDRGRHVLFRRRC